MKSLDPSRSSKSSVSPLRLGIWLGLGKEDRYWRHIFQALFHTGPESFVFYKSVEPEGFFLSCLSLGLDQEVLKKSNSSVTFYFKHLVHGIIDRKEKGQHSVTPSLSFIVYRIRKIEHSRSQAVGRLIPVVLTKPNFQYSEWSPSS